jgi:hypothetical protein
MPWTVSMSVTLRKAIIKQCVKADMQASEATDPGQTSRMNMDAGRRIDSRDGRPPGQVGTSGLQFRVPAKKSTVPIGVQQAGEDTLRPR